MRRLLFFFVVVVSLFTLVACNDTPPVVIELDQPTGVVMNEGIVSWNAVENATGYRVFVGQTQYTTTLTQYDLTVHNFAHGNYNVSIIAYNATQVSLPSSSVLFVVELISTLASPQNPQITAGIFSFDEVNDATSYVVSIGDITYHITQASFDLSQITLKQGNHAVSVKAVNASETSALTAPLSYEVLSNQLSSEYSRVLLMYDNYFVPGMTENDFNDSWDYHYYLSSTHIASTFFLSGNELGLNDEIIIHMFDEIINPEQSAPLTMQSLMATVASMQDMHVDAHVLASWLTTMMATMIESNKFDAMRSVHNYEASIASLEADIASILTQPEVIFLMNSLQMHLSATDYELFLSYLYTQDINAYYSFSYEMYNTFWDAYHGEQPYYLEDEPEGLNSVLFRYYQALKIALDDEYINFYNTYVTHFYAIESIYNLSRNILYHQESLNYYQDIIQSALDDSSSILQDRLIYTDAIALMMEYMWQLNNTLPLALAISIDELMQDETLSIEEAMIIKDELLDVLMLNLPSLSDFVTLNQAMVKIMSMATEIEVTDEAAFVSSMASMQRVMIEGIVTFIHYIDVEDYETAASSVEVLASMGRPDVSMLLNPDSLQAMHDLFGIYHGFEASYPVLVENLEAEALGDMLDYVILYVVYMQSSRMRVYKSASPFEMFGEYPHLISDAARSAWVIMHDLKDGLFAPDSTAIGELEAIYAAIDLEPEAPAHALSLMQWVNTYLLDLSLTEDDFGNLIALAMSTTRLSYDVEVQKAFIDALTHLGGLSVTAHQMIRDFIDFMVADDAQMVLDFVNNRLVYEEYIYEEPIYEYLCDNLGCSYRIVGYNTYTEIHTTPDPMAHLIFFQGFSVRLSAFLMAYPAYEADMMLWLDAEGTADLWAHLFIATQRRNSYNDLSDAYIDFLFQDAIKHVEVFKWLLQRGIESLHLNASSDGLLFDLYLEMMYGFDNDEFALQAIQELMLHVNNMLNHVDETNIDAFISLIRLQMVMHSYYIYEEDMFIDYLTVTDLMILAGTDIALDALELVRAFGLYFSQHANTFDPTLEASYQTDMMTLLLIESLAGFLDEINEAAIQAVIDQLFTDVLLMPDFIDFFGMDSSYINQMHLDISDMFTAFVEKIHTLHAYLGEESFMSYYYIDAALRNGLFDTSPIYFTILDQGLMLTDEINTVAHTDETHHVFTFTPTLSGNYELGVAGEVIHESWSVYTLEFGHYSRVKYYDTYNTPYSTPLVQLEAGKEYFIVFTTSFSDRNIDLTLNLFDDTGYNESKAIELLLDQEYAFKATRSGNEYNFLFTPTTTQEFEISIANSGSYIGIHVYELDGEFKYNVAMFGVSGTPATGRVFLTENTNYLIKLTYSYPIDSTIIINEVFANTLDTAIVLDLDTYFSFSDLGPYSLVWLKFAPGEANNFFLTFDIEGYYMIDIYDANLDNWVGYNSYTSSKFMTGVSTPEDGIYIVMTSHPYTSDYIGLNIVKHWSYIRKEIIELDEYITITPDTVNVYKIEVSFTAPADANYFFFAENYGGSYLYAYVDDNQVNFISWNPVQGFNGFVYYLYQGQTMVLKPSNFAEEDTGITVIDYDQQLITQAALTVDTELWAVKYTNVTEVYMEFTPTETREYSLRVNFMGSPITVKWYLDGVQILSTTTLYSEVLYSDVELTEGLTYTIEIYSPQYILRVYLLHIQEHNDLR